MSSVTRALNAVNRRRLRIARQPIGITHNLNGMPRRGSPPTWVAALALIKLQPRQRTVGGNQIGRDLLHLPNSLLRDLHRQREEFVLADHDPS